MSPLATVTPTQPAWILGDLDVGTVTKPAHNRYKSEQDGTKAGFVGKSSDLRAPYLRFPDVLAGSLWGQELCLGSPKLT